MIKERPAAASLFELLARQWNLDDEIVQCNFNADNSALVFRLGSGKMALMATKDAESTKSRTRIEVDSGRMTIQRRTKPVPKAVFAGINLKHGLPMVRLGASGFLAVDDKGSLQHITAAGKCIEKPGTSDSEVTALGGDQNGETVAIARRSGLSLYQSEKLDESTTKLEFQNQIENIAFASSTSRLALYGEECLQIIDTNNTAAPAAKFDGLGNITQMTWQAAGNYLACATSEKAFHLVNVDALESHTVHGYPGPVFNTVFNENGKALVTSGAYRLTGWSTDDLPGNNHEGTPLTTGKAGLTIINAISSHPERSLIAAGYANGLVTVTSIGSTQEMMVHHEPESEVSCMTWSKTGEHLAIGFKSGKAALVTFPDNLFK